MESELFSVMDPERYIRRRLFARDALKEVVTLKRKLAKPGCQQLGCLLSPNGRLTYVTKHDYGRLARERSCIEGARMDRHPTDDGDEVFFAWALAHFRQNVVALLRGSGRQSAEGFPCN